MKEVGHMKSIAHESRKGIQQSIVYIEISNKYSRAYLIAKIG
jgi:hypothetical protein